MRPIDADTLKRGIEILCKDKRARISAATYFALVAFINNMPTIEAEPVKHGRWDVHDVVKILSSGETLDGFCQCENCGIIMPYHYSEYDFCPNCGVKMDGD